jgi:hypothetical protein
MRSERQLEPPEAPLETKSRNSFGDQRAGYKLSLLMTAGNQPPLSKLRVVCTAIHAVS